ncbi:MAG: DUF2505 domain-containing protein [Sinimarinibacterium sp.]|jgi:hypothetical protein
MKHEMQARYPAPSEVVIRMMTDRDFHTRRLEALGMTRYRVLDHAFDGREFRIRIERHVPVQMPGLKGGAETVVVNEECWNVSTRSGSVTVEAKGMPVQMSCTTRMSDDGDGCVLSFDWDISASIPLVGKTLEKFIVTDMGNRAEDETRAGVSLLDGYR